MYRSRLATHEDFDFVYGLYFHEDNNKWLLYDPISKESFRPIFQKLLDQNQKYIFLVDEIPTAMFKLVPNVYRSAHVVYLGGVALDEDQKGKKLGHALFEEIFRLARSQHFLRMELSVSITNQRAIYLYEKLGFKREGQLADMVKFADSDQLFDEYLYAKRL